MKVRYLHRSADRQRLALIEEAARAEELSNVFNLGALVAEDLTHYVFRALPRGGSKPFHAFYATVTADGVGAVRSLTQHAASHGVSPVADPKLFTARDGRVFVTFNTGQPAARESNAVYVMQVAPILGNPQLCVLPDRSPVEKNWAFADQGEAGLTALYDLASLSTLRLIDGALGASDELRFERRASASGSRRPGVAFSIGTQLLEVGDRYLFVTHEKIGIRSRRAYFGRLSSVRFDDGVIASLDISKVRLLHSFRESLPQRGIHNPALISATYFAGLSAEGDDLILGYGVNDVSFSIARVKESTLWS